jgi:type I restriction enzyme S subunit
MSTAESLITDHLAIWSSAIKAKASAGRGGTKKQEFYGIKKLRELILELAVRGLLVPQDPVDEPASEYLKKIANDRAALIKSGKLKKMKHPPVDTTECPHDIPSAWQWVRFGEIAIHNAGKTLDQGRNSGELRDYITTSNLYWGRFDLTDVRKMAIR